MKGLKWVFLLCAMILAGNAVQAQNDDAREDRKKEAQEFFESLDLTEKQKEQIEAERERMRDEIKAFREEGKGADARKRIETMRKDHDLVMKDILTDEQYQQWVEKRDERKHHRKRRPNR